MKSDQVIRVGVVGCGQFMSQQHIQTINRSSTLRLEHLADLNAERRDEIARQYLATRSSADWQDVVADPAVEVIVVGVLPQLHPEIAIAALRHGKPVFVEKPLAPTSEECLAVQQVADECQLPVAVGFNRRFAPATQFMQKAIEEAGSPVSIFYRISDDDRIRPPEQQWKKEDRLLLEVVHIFDLLAFLVKAEPATIYARETRFNDALVTIEFANGSRATIMSSAWGSLEQPKEHLEMILNHGTLEMDDFVEIRTFGLAHAPRIVRFAGRPYDGCDNSHVEDFARRGREAMIDLRRRYFEVIESSGVLSASSNPDNWVKMRQGLKNLRLPQINYASDKGWGEALEGFCRAAVQGNAPLTANAIDGNRATACAVAARKAVAIGQAVTLDPREWLGADS